LIVLAPDFMTKICKKAAQDFQRAVSKVFDRVKSVALWSANIRKLAKDHKGYVPQLLVCILLFDSVNDLPGGAPSIFHFRHFINKQYYSPL